MGVGTVRRRGAIGNRLASQTTVGGSAHYFAEINVAGGREHIQMESAVPDIWLAVYSGEQIGIDLQSDTVGKFVVIAKERRFIEKCLTQEFLTLEILRHCIKNLIHAEVLFIEHVFFQY